MTRNKNLIPLSHEHHIGLQFCWRLEQGIRKGAEPALMQEYALHFWTEHMQPHFQKEEELLLPMLPVGHTLSQQLEQEHQEIRELINELYDAQELEVLVHLRDVVYNHIRFEERLLFPLIESSADKKELQQLGDFLMEEESQRKDDFSPAFWR